MSDMVISLSLPLDADGFFRRECPFCSRQFKILMRHDELADLAQKGLDSYMVETKGEEPDTVDDAEPETEFTCPYCAQQATRSHWWTQEQIAFVRVVGRNILASLVNEHLIGPLEKMSRELSSGPVSIHFKGQKMEQLEPWISPEVNDMKIFDTPCCKRKIKIDETWSSTVHCYFCGFPYEHDAKSS
jgi:hypothetical protein